MLKKIYSKLKNKSKKPEHITFFVTNKCNLKCTHCFYDTNQNDNDLTFESIKKISSSIKTKLSGLVITGGEPFLRRDILDILLLLSNKTKKIIIATNGVLTEEIIDKMRVLREKYTGIIEIQVSLDGTEDTHNAIRGCKSFYNTVSTLEKLKSIQNIEISTSTTISKLNYENMDILAQFLKGLNVINKFNFCRDMKNNIFNVSKINNFEIPNISLDIDDILKINSQLDISFPDKFQKKKRKIMYTILKEQTNQIQCFAGIKTTVIYSDGKMSICESISPEYDLKKSDFDFNKTWESMHNKYQSKGHDCCCTDPCNIVYSLSQQ